VGVSAPDRASVAPAPKSGCPAERRRLGPVTVLQIYVVLLVLIPPSLIFGPLGGVGTPANVVGLGALLLWGLAVLTPGDHLRRTVVPVRVILGLLVGVNLLGYTLLNTRAVPIDELLASDRMILQVLSWGGVALLAAECLRDRDDLYRVLRTVAVAVAVMSAVALIQFYAGYSLADLADLIPVLQRNSDVAAVLARDGFRRPAGTATHPIEFGCVVAMALPIALHLARFDRERPKLRRWLPPAVIAIGVPIAVSRSGVLGAAVAMAVVFVGLEPKVRPRAVAAASAVVVFMYATTPGLLGTIRNLFLNAGSDDSITTRTSDYDVVADFVRQSPWIGRGPGTLLPTKYLYLDNQYLLSVIEIGIVGLVVVLAYLLTTSFLGRGARHRSTDATTRDLGQAFAAAGIAGAVTAFTFDGFSFLMFGGFIALSIGLSGALWNMQRSHGRELADPLPAASAAH